MQRNESEHMRIFFGATLPVRTRKEILELQSSLRGEVPDAKFEGEDKLHITLQFIGDFPRDQVTGLYDAAGIELRKRAIKSQPTDVVGIEYFPSAKMKRGIWLDCRDAGALSRLEDALKTACHGYGIVAEERTFKPHITIARIKQRYDQRGKPNFFTGSRARGGPGDAADLQKFKREGKLSVEQFFPISVALFESTLKPSGSEYRILYEYSLEQSEEDSTR